MQPSGRHHWHSIFQQRKISPPAEKPPGLNESFVPGFMISDAELGALEAQAKSPSKKLDHTPDKKTLKREIETKLRNISQTFTRYKKAFATRNPTAYYPEVNALKKKMREVFAAFAKADFKGDEFGQYKLKVSGDNKSIEYYKSKNKVLYSLDLDSRDDSLFITGEGTLTTQYCNTPPFDDYSGKQWG